MAPAQVSAQIFNAKNERVGRRFSGNVTPGQEKITLSAKLDGVKLWNAETPNPLPGAIPRLARGPGRRCTRRRAVGSGPLKCGRGRAVFERAESHIEGGGPPQFLARIGPHAEQGCCY